MALRVQCRDFPGGPVVEKMLSNTGYVGSIPGWETKIPHILGKLSLSTTTKTQRINNNFFKMNFKKFNKEKKGGTE